jgi:hypothetical protein
MLDSYDDKLQPHRSFEGNDHGLFQNAVTYE